MSSYEGYWFTFSLIIKRFSTSSHCRSVDDDDDIVRTCGGAVGDL